MVQDDQNRTYPRYLPGEFLIHHTRRLSENPLILDLKVRDGDLGMFTIAHFG